MNNKLENAWLKELARKRPTMNLATLQKACDLILDENDLMWGQKIADSLIRLKCDEDTLCAALLYPSFKLEKISDEKIVKTLGKPIHKLLLGTEKMESIDAIKINDGQLGFNKLDNLRKMLIAMVDDIRVVLIKLAERLSALKRVKNSTELEKQTLANQVMKIYAPLANRLGVGQLKWRLEDLAFRYLDPDAYRPIAKQLLSGQEEREKFVEQRIRKLEQLLKKNNFAHFSVSGRAKHIYSIYQKLKRKAVDFAKIYDTSAFRILVPSIKDCYTVLSLIHSTWNPISEEFDDYIANPKPNGYRSIHTAIRDSQGLTIEIQIRTYEMHEASELGVAAHWKYKEASESTSAYEEKINWLRKVMDWQQDLAGDTEQSRELSLKIFADRIYVFTPNGDIFDLEKGATPIDFAYHLHTELGHRCRGAKVNNALVPLTQALTTGDRVEIIAAKESKPSRDWLNPHLHYAKTKVALNKIRQWFNRIDRENAASWGIPFSEKELPRIAKPKIPAEAPSEKIAPPPEVDVLGKSRLLTKIALCCKPNNHDIILGYITKNRGISIHKKACANIQHSSQKHPERIIEINWKNQLT